MRHNDAGVIRKSRRIWCRLSPNKFRSTLQENETGDSSWADGRLIARCILFIIYLPFDSQGNIVSPATLSSLLHNQLTFLLLSESVLPQLNTTCPRRIRCIFFSDAVCRPALRVLLVDILRLYWFPPAEFSYSLYICRLFLSLCRVDVIFFLLK